MGRSILLQVSVLVFVCTGIRGGAQPGDLITDRESYAVFATALSVEAGARGYDGTVAVLQQTRAVTTCPSEKSAPPAWRAVIANHRQENARVRTLRPDANMGRPYTLVSLAELRTLMRKAGYDLLTFKGEQSPGSQVFRAFPGGRLVAFSAVGFDEKKTRAMVTLQYDCFPEAENRPPYRYCHQYHQLMLERSGSEWLRSRNVQACFGAA